MNAYCIKCEGAVQLLLVRSVRWFVVATHLKSFQKLALFGFHSSFFSLNILFWIVNVVLWFIEFFVCSNEKKNWLLHLRTVFLFWNQDHYSMSIFLSQVFISIKIKKRGKLYTKINVNDQKFPNADAPAAKWKSMNLIKSTKSHS